MNISTTPPTQPSSDDYSANGADQTLHMAVVIPAHNEEQHIGACLAAVEVAIAQLPVGVSASLVVVLDNCDDDTFAIVARAGVAHLRCDYRCVGRVRDLGMRHAIKQGATWIACTDADSLVAKDWLSAQYRHIASEPVDMICGVVSIADWSHLTAQTKAQYLAHYQDRMDHRHIHGANLSVCANAYVRVGGFAHIGCHEDVDLVTRFVDQGYRLIWSNRVRVVTSSRLEARAKDGFAAFLVNLEQGQSGK